ncbi:MAG: ATP-binding protein, partial [Myxococcota bacterium]
IGRDEGVGIPKAELGAVFRPFFRAESGRAQAEGIGLGLSFALRIVEAHGGTLTLASDATHGTEAALRLPLRSGSARP